MTDPTPSPPQPPQPPYEGAYVPAEPAPAPPAALTRSPLSDGEWHRLHPLTPVLRGGLFLLVIFGIVITNFRDRLIGWLFPAVADYDEYDGDPVDYIWNNNLWLVASLVVLGVLLLVIAWFWLSWRFHTFRITGDDVEVRSGILFRTHRRAPLDRVQGVNLTRPLIARLLGAAKLEVVGAGMDSNVKLEYLSTGNAEEVRADILRLASGRQLAEKRQAAAGGVPLTRQAAGIVTTGLSGIIDGVDTADTVPESVVSIPMGRLVASRLLSLSTVWLLLMIAGVILGAIYGTPWVLFSLVPAIIGFGAYWFGSITKVLRYSIAQTPSGVRITFGLFTTVTEVLPPGRVHAFEIHQPLLWRPFGWWRLRINKLSGGSASDSQALQSAEVLPVGTREDAERVLRLFLPDVSAQDWQLLADHGLEGPREDDPYTTTPRRARVFQPISWRRNGFLLAPAALLIRRGRLRRTLVILPLARLQSVRLNQGPFARALNVAALTGDTVAGLVAGYVSNVDRAAAVQLWQETATAAIRAAAGDHSHRWGADIADLASDVASDVAEAADPSDVDAEL